MPDPDNIASEGAPQSGPALPVKALDSQVAARRGNSNQRTAAGSHGAISGPAAVTGSADDAAAWRSDSSLADDECPGGIDQSKLFGGGEEDPLYDPAADEEDTQWVHKQRGGRKSDAILSCPCCFTTLCIECQQHDKYPNQFRAMFVMNCRVDQEHVKVAPRKGGKQSRKQALAGAVGEQEELKPVMCDVCNAEVGVMDKEEVYHFYNAFPSNA